MHNARADAMNLIDFMNNKVLLVLQLQSYNKFSCKVAVAMVF